MPSTDDLSEFEAKDYSEKLAEAFETGERMFMSKLRNYEHVPTRVEFG